MNKPNDVRVSRETVSFEFRHPANGEVHTVSVSLEEIAHHMCEVLFEKLCGEFCQCEPAGETNVVDCRCDEYADEFERVKYYAQPADQQGKTERNQCDGCQAGIPIIRGCHRMGNPSGYSDLMSCTENLYRHAQPATANVVLPERLEEGGLEVYDNFEYGWNACLDEVAHLNGVQS